MKEKKTKKSLTTAKTSHFFNAINIKSSASPALPSRRSLEKKTKTDMSSPASRVFLRFASSNAASVGVEAGVCAHVWRVALPFRLPSDKGVDISRSRNVVVHSFPPGALPRKSCAFSLRSNEHIKESIARESLIVSETRVRRRSCLRDARWLAVDFFPRRARGRATSSLKAEKT